MAVYLNNILFLRTDRLGDFLLNLPAIHALKNAYPKSHVSVALHPNVLNLVKGHSSIDELISFTPAPLRNNKTSIPFWACVKFFWKLRKKDYDAVIISNPHKYFHLLTFLMRIPIRVGYDRKWGFLLTHTISDRKSENQKHEIEYNLDLISQLSVLSDSSYKNAIHYEIPISQTAAQDLQKLLIQKKIPPFDDKPLIVVNPLTTSAFKQWPIVKFIQLLQKLSTLTYSVILIGGHCEGILIKKEIMPHLSQSNIFDLSGLTTLPQLAVLLKKASLLISNDSGPVHIACAFNTKTLVLFGNQYGSHPKRWGPWGHGNHRIIERHPIEMISVEDVWKQLQNQLNISSS